MYLHTNTTMENFIPFNPNLSLALPILLLLFITIWLRNSARRNPFPPGPKGLPLIGNLLMMKDLTHRRLAELAEVYGGLCHLRMGQLHMVAVSTPEIARQVLQTQDNLFSNRPATVAISYLTYNRADMAFAHYGPFWRQMRKICVTKVFSRKRAESWASVREEIDSFLKNVDARIGSSVNIGEMVLGLTRDITYRAAFGSISEEGQEEFLRIMQEFSKLFGEFNVLDFMPWLGWITYQGADLHKRLDRARGSLDVFIDKIIDDHLDKKTNRKSNEVCDGFEDDMVDELMEFCDENGGKSDLGSAISITRDNIKALIMDVMFGGTETVASAIEWAMAELMKSWEDLNKLQQELANVVGLDRKVHESDLDKLTYLKCVAKETLRLHPPIPLLLHETTVDTVVDGFRIPARARVMINSWAIGRDKNAWDDPSTFKPSRFLDVGAPDFKGSNFEFIPFGSGRRSCPGMQLGLYALELTLANLCHCFNWTLPDGMKPSELDMNDVFGLTAPRAVQLVAIPTRRLTRLI
ncbi:cytochrome P450 84A1-like [Primulina huaijiensis]|uniref:cytochrome P450 84A1-like n=1 Tax=Primulina huaijiensis TaxID=1492673 RepID=UPI003CC75C7D